MKAKAIAYFLVTILAATAWIALLLAGILVDSRPLRAQLAQLLGDSLLDHLSPTLEILGGVIATYTYTNVILLAMLASFLGSVAATVNIGPDSVAPAADATYPRTSALLRGFLIALAMLAGVLVASDNAFDATQTQYYKTASFVSLTAFLTSLSPDLIKKLVDQFSSFILQSGQPQRFSGTSAKAARNQAMNIVFRNSEAADSDMAFTVKQPDGTPVSTVSKRSDAAGSVAVPWTPSMAGRHRVCHPTSADFEFDVG